MCRIIPRLLEMGRLSGDRYIDNHGTSAMAIKVDWEYNTLCIKNIGISK